MSKIIKIKSLIQVIIASLYLIGSTGVSFAQEWRSLASDHFIVYFTEDENFAKDISNKAEYYYVRIASDLGYPRYSEFWTWDNRVKIYIYPDHDSYLKVSKMSSWSEGMADYTNKQIISYTQSESFADSILPHEMAHLIFRDFVGFKGEVPVWLDEGVAQWAEPLKRERVKTVSQNLLNNATFFSVADMVNLDIRKVSVDSVIEIHSMRNKDGNRTLLSLKGGDVVKIYYIEAVSLIGFLIDSYGAISFTEFCRQLRDGKSLEDAIRSAYSIHISGIEELESAWLKYLRGS
jgi:hypothetical protein